MVPIILATVSISELNRAVAYLLSSHPFLQNILQWYQNIRRIFREENVIDITLGRTQEQVESKQFQGTAGATRYLSTLPLTTYNNPP
jgi:hypothetical protein